MESVKVLRNDRKKTTTPIAYLKVNLNGRPPENEIASRFFSHCAVFE